MKLKESNKRILTALLLGFFVVGFNLSTIDAIFYNFWNGNNYYSFFGSGINLSQPSSTIIYAFFDSVTSHPLAFLFQILFILFLISPPIIALLLFCIWKELKKRNELE